uniref:Diphosphate--fructose-6-phosphate 1-phosphotransferase n=1 Tax=Ascaris lumbricoides TaxID=6252 RepID=A0A0M3IV21_ASCLU
MFPAICRFSGADPEAEKNKQLFESLPGHYFQRAVGGGSGFSMARVFDVRYK